MEMTKGLQRKEDVWEWSVLNGPLDSWNVKCWRWNFKSSYCNPLKLFWNLMNRWFNAGFNDSNSNFSWRPCLTLDHKTWNRIKILFFLETEIFYDRIHSLLHFLFIDGRFLAALIFFVRCDPRECWKNVIKMWIKFLFNVSFSWGERDVKVRDEI